MLVLVIVIIAVILAASFAKRLIVPILILGVIAYVIGSIFGGQGRDPPNATRVALPHDQQLFCDAIERADTSYEPAQAAWYRESNPAVREDMTTSLQKMRQARDRAVYSIIGHGAVSAWAVKLTYMRIDDEDKGSHRVQIASVSGTLLCKNEVTASAEIVVTPEVHAFLRLINLGDIIRVTGRFLPHDADRQTPEQALDWDGFEGPAMSSPSYRIDIWTMRAEGATGR